MAMFLPSYLKDAALRWYNNTPLDRRRDWAFVKENFLSAFQNVDKVSMIQVLAVKWNPAEKSFLDHFNLMNQMISSVKIAESPNPARKGIMEASLPSFIQEALDSRMSENMNDWFNEASAIIDKVMLRQKSVVVRNSAALRLS